MTREEAIVWLEEAYERRCMIDSFGTHHDSFGMTNDRAQLEKALSAFTDSERWRIRVHCWVEVLDRRLYLAATSSDGTDESAEYARWAPFEALVQATLDVIIAGYRGQDAWAYHQKGIGHYVRAR